MLLEVDASCYCSVPEFLIYILLCRVKSLSIIEHFYPMSHRKLYNPLLVQCPLFPIWPPILPLNQNLTLLIPFKLRSSTLPSVGISHSVCQTSCPFSFP